MRKYQNHSFSSLNKNSIAVRKAIGRIISKHGDRVVYGSMALLLKAACKNFVKYENVCNGTSKSKNLIAIADCIRMLDTAFTAIKKGKQCSFDGLDGPDWETCDRLTELINLATPEALEEKQFKELIIVTELLHSLSICYDWKTILYR